MDDVITVSLALLAGTLRLAVPLYLAALGGFFSERAGIVDVGLEGKMLISAFGAAAAAHVSGSPWIGLLAGLGAGVSFALIHGIGAIRYRANQVVSGMALNILAAGLTATIAAALYSQGGRTPQLPDGARFRGINLMQDNSAMDPALRAIVELFVGHNILVYFSLILVPGMAWLIGRTRFGLRLRAVGENPGAVDTAGISVAALRYQASILSGLMCGLAGTYIAIAQSAGFVPNMTAGKGYLALAALIFGKWRIGPTFFACLLFAFADAAQSRLQGVILPGIGAVPVQFIQALPYFLTLILLAGFVGRAVPPKAIGIPYVKER
jgi:simple sugar transport system permease protein